MGVKVLNVRDEPANRICEVEDEYAFLGCNALRGDGYTAVLSDICPDMRDSNHVRQINLPRGADPEGFISRAEELFRSKGREHCRFDLDCRTRPQCLYTALRKSGYVPHPTVVQVYRGHDAEGAGAVFSGLSGGQRDDRQSDFHPSASGSEEWRNLMREHYAGYGQCGAFVERAVDLAIHRLAAAWGEGRDYRVFLAFTGDDSDASGVCEIFRHKGVAKIERLYVRKNSRMQGIGSSMIMHAVDYALRAGDDLAYLVADSLDWPRRMYRKLGFEDLMEIVEWTRIWGGSADDEGYVTW